MTASPADIAKYTNDGRLIVVKNEAIKTVHVGAQDVGSSELPMFNDNPNDAQTLLNQRFSVLGMVGRPHEGIQVDSDIGLGTTIPIAPTAPNAYAIDPTRGMVARTAIRAYSFDYTNDSFALELTGTTA